MQSFCTCTNSVYQALFSDPDGRAFENKASCFTFCKSLKVAEPKVCQVVRRVVLTLRMVGNRFNGPVMGHGAQLKAP